MVWNMKIILIRHGKTAGNEQGKYIGCKTDEALSEKGISEAKACDFYREYESNKGLKVYASPMLRARETAEYLFKQNYTVIPELTEMDFGEFEGMNYEMLNGNQDYQRFIDSGGTLPFPKGETREAFIQRSVKGFRDIVSQMEEEDTAAVICHGGNIMAILSSLTGEDYYDFQVKNLEGYEIDLRIEHERLSDISYNRITGRNNS